MSNLQELISQRAALAAKIAELQGAARAEAIGKVKALMAEHGLTAADIGGRATAARTDGEAKAPSKVAVKFRNVATGATWSGRGLKPKWLTAALASGAKVEDFAV